MNLNPVSIAFQFLCFTFAVAAGTSAPTHITGDISINCGSSGTSSALNGRKWLGDVQHNLSSMLQIKGSSTASSVVVRKLKSVDPVPHRTARLSRGRFSYAFQLNPGQKVIRLHFNPSQYKGFKGLKDLLNVEAGAFTLLSNFSASLTADALRVSSFTKEFCLNILENQQLNITFFPATSQSYAFINGIELISVPASFSYFHGGDIGVQMVGHKSPVYVDHIIALEIVHRATVKQSSTPSTGDSDDMFPTWAVREANKINKSTWRVPVDVGFRYLIRIYFSEIGIKILGTADVMFEIVINEMIAQTNIDIVKERSGDNNPRYNDYMVMMRGQRNEDKHDILISIQSYDETVDGKGILEGFQILKLSNSDNSLAGTNPLPPAQTTESHTIQILLSILGLRNIIATVVVVVTSLINVAVYTLREMWEASHIEEKNKPSARADRVCRRFSLGEMELATRNFSEALVIGRGGFGKVYEGLIDNGQETVAIKRQKFTSSQGTHEFLTEIEMLSELRHVNLVSLIGYCNDHGEMILVYEYMASGTLADHLYKLERGKDTCSPLSWKRRLNICIGAGRGLDYLHTGHRTIHRDIKASNILLDENFVAKVADFGLAKPEDRQKLQSHVTTKVKGTPGYFDPFYLSTCRLTRKSDTYAFGVLLLEVLCGRPALDLKLDEDERILYRWALNKISEGEVNEIAASSLRDEISADSLKTFVGVAERCLHAEPKNRPTMAQVVLQLELALEQQEGRQFPVSNEMAIVSDGISARNDAIELKMASTDVQNLTPLPEDQINSRVINGELPYQRKDGRKTIMHKPPRLWPWNALWNRVKPSRTNEMLLSEICEKGIKLAKFDWNTITDATNHFSLSNEVGCGGFGPVYKVVLPTGLVVAVKRLLSPLPAQGHSEFENEILLLPNLQHRNIIRLLGYCIHRKERLLVYEFMENRSLDAYLGDRMRNCLDWNVRMKIVTGIARAILYLHRDSGHRVIYRDLKPNNILLDSEMNPKLSDFGLAKILVDGQFELQTCRIRGTYGYMPPECSIYGKLSTEVDVFSFGIVVLEIVSGRRNIISPDQGPILLSNYAWELWKEGRVLDLIDQSLEDKFQLEEALRCIKVGLLCIQLEPHDRPNMYHVIKMLDGVEPLVEPRKPWRENADGYSSYIGRWMRAMKIIVRIYLASSEKFSTDQIFGEVDALAAVCFSESSKAAMLQLSKFCETIAIASNQPENLIRILNIYEVLEGVTPDIVALYSDDESGSCIRYECQDILKRLGDCARATFLEFENLVSSNVSANPFAGSGIHPLTRYVMNYIEALMDYSKTLDEVLKDPDEHEDDYNDNDNSASTSPDTSPLSQDEQFGGNSSNSPMATHFQSVISILESNLKGKLKLYKDEPLQHLFLMNNIHYMAENVKNSELKNVLGNDWIRKHNWKIQQHAMNYERSTWSSILGLLKDEGLQHPGSNSLSKTILKERLQNFYSAFEKVYNSQTSWLILDIQLRDDLRISASLKVIQAYRSFVGRFRSHVSVKHIKYSADDLEDFLLDLFEGSHKSLHGGHKKRG